MHHIIPERKVMEMSWKYEIRDNERKAILLEDEGFETEEDAIEQAKMEADCRNIKNFYIRTAQVYDAKIMP